MCFVIDDGDACGCRYLHEDVIMVLLFVTGLWVKILVPLYSTTVTLCPVSLLEGIVMEVRSDLDDSLRPHIADKRTNDDLTEDSPHNPATEEKMSGTSEVEGTDIPDGYKVHIGGIPKGVKKEELTEELEKVGDFSGLRIVHSKRKTKGHAFVYFKNKAFSAEDMKRLNQITLHGNKIEANESKTNGKNENKKDIMKNVKEKQGYTPILEGD
ncbi:hypothetical protein D1007_49060 [Hordeum vulgare]|nr:hypothetical protein D1007_49060 [Hordeum vulgare]